MCNEEDKSKTIVTAVVLYIWLQHFPSNPRYRIHYTGDMIACNGVAA